MKHVFIINPIAGKSNVTKKLSQSIETIFTNKNYTIEITEYAGHAKEIASLYKDNGEEVYMYSCGGDGTLYEIVNGIHGAKNIALAIVPTGTGNDFIKYFSDIPKESFLDLSNYSNATIYVSDVITCNSHVCLNIASVGMDAMVVQKVARYKRIPFIGPRFAYYLSIFQCFLSSIHFKQSLLIDDTIKIDTKTYLFVAVANGKYYGGSFNPTPMADIQDGFLDVLTIDSLPRRKIIQLLGIYSRGEHLSYDFANHYKCKKIKIMGDTVAILNLDGETIEIKDPEISILPSAIRLLLPQK